VHPTPCSAPLPALSVRHPCSPRSRFPLLTCFAAGSPPSVLCGCFACCADCCYAVLAPAHLCSVALHLGTRWTGKGRPLTWQRGLLAATNLTHRCSHLLMAVAPAPAPVQVWIWRMEGHELYFEKDMPLRFKAQSVKFHAAPTLLEQQQQREAEAPVRVRGTGRCLGWFARSAGAAGGGLAVAWRPIIKLDFFYFLFSFFLFFFVMVEVGFDC
jgi:hypothetical protein